jgi:rod shape determining protein RodA
VFADKTKFLLIVDIVLMLLPSVPGLGYNAMGMTGWVQIPLINFRFQPSELAKPITILLMASLVGGYNGKVDTLRDYLKLCAVLSIPFLLILTQPDLGTGLIVLVLGATIIVCGGAKGKWVLITVGIIVVGAFAVVAMSMTEGMPHLLKQYQLNRLIVFVDPSVDPAGNGYNLQQAKIAVGSGGLLGKGVGNASQSGSGFLPEAHTDFVFALLAEEFGFLGSVMLLGLFGWMILATIGLGLRVETPFAKLVCVGVAAMWTFQLMQNVGMCIGIMPITGIPLPFVSFGSSSMVSQLLSAGLVQSVWRHRKKAG